jgi:uncharacterized membrane protein YbhN (UPF0104 family)
MNRLVRRVIVAMLFGVVVYGAFALYTGLDRIGGSLGTYRWSSFGVALALSSFNYLLRFCKWQYYLRRLGVEGVRPLDSLLVFMSGFVLTVTPGKVGEVFKSAVLAKTHGVPIAQTAPIVVAERLTDVIAIVCLIVLGSTTFAGGLSWAVAGAIAVAVGLVLIVWEPPIRALLAWCGTRRGGLGRLAPKLVEAYRSLRIVAAPVALLWPTLLSIVGWGAEALALYLILAGFGEQVPLGRSMFFYATATLAGALIPVPGGLGVVEGMIREQLVHLSGVADGAATASMMLIRIATLWWSVALGFAALAWLRLRFPRALGDDAALPVSAKNSALK